MSPTVVTVPGSAMTMAKQASHDNVQALRDQITMLEAQLAAKTHHQAWCPMTEASISNTELFATACVAFSSTVTASACFTTSPA
jgi:hypothetical protein